MCHNIIEPGEQGEPVYDAAGNAGRGIHLLAEYLRLYIYEDVAEHAAKGSRHGAHEDCRPHGEAEREGLLDADDDKQCQPDGVEQQESLV